MKAFNGTEFARRVETKYVSLLLIFFKSGVGFLIAVLLSIHESADAVRSSPDP